MSKQDSLQNSSTPFYSDVKAKAVCIYKAITEIGFLTGLAPSDNFGDGRTSVKACNIQL